MNYFLGAILSDFDVQDEDFTWSRSCSTARSPGKSDVGDVEIVCFVTAGCR